MNDYPTLFRASGAINIASFVSIDPAQGFSVLQSSTGQFPVGISSEASQGVPFSLTGGTPSVSQAATAAGQSLNVYTVGSQCLVVSADTINPGDLLGPNSSGAAITLAKGSGTYYGAIALQPISSGNYGRVLVIQGVA